MHARTEEFAERVREAYGLDPAVVEFPEGTKTAADAAAAIGCSVGRIASSIVLIADGSPVVAVVSGADRVSEDRLGEVVEADRVRMAEPDEVREATGWSIGGVPPVAHDGDPRVIVDEGLLAFGTVWAAAGTPEAVFEVDPERIVALADAEAASITG